MHKDGKTLLLYAIENKYKNITKYLIEHGADVNKENEDGDTPLNHEKLLAYMKEHPDAYLREIAAHFSEGLTTIWNALHRLGVKYKKTKNLQHFSSV